MVKFIVHQYYASIRCRCCNAVLKTKDVTGKRKGPFSKEPIASSSRNMKAPKAFEISGSLSSEYNLRIINVSFPFNENSPHL